jgi:hypothetical protein
MTSFMKDSPRQPARRLAVAEGANRLPAAPPASHSSPVTGFPSGDSSVSLWRPAEESPLAQDAMVTVKVCEAVCFGWWLESLTLMVKV